MAGQAFLGGRQGLRRNSWDDPREEDQGQYGNYEDAAEGIPPS